LRFEVKGLGFRKECVARGRALGRALRITFSVYPRKECVATGMALGRYARTRTHIHTQTESDVRRAHTQQ